MRMSPTLPPSRTRRALLAVSALAALVLVSCTPSDPGQVKHDSRGTAAAPSKEIDLTNQGSTYVGVKVCDKCHARAGEHAALGVHVKAFQSNPRNAREGELCESCHGPGSKHAHDDNDDHRLMISFTRKWDTPVATMNAVCLSCHQGAQRLYWERSTHDINAVACTDCHNPMFKTSVTGALVRTSIAETCYTCHAQQRAEFLRRSHMPVPEGKMSCVDCHNPHGSPTRPLLKADTVNEVCYPCHAEKRGPFIWEHAPARENCGSCHLPHGSNNEHLLVTPGPFLCQQCHSQTGGHAAAFFTNANTVQSAGAIQAIGVNALNFQTSRLIGQQCENCHSQVHGSNHPSGARFGR